MEEGYPGECTLGNINFRLFLQDRFPQGEIALLNNLVIYKSLDKKLLLGEVIPLYLLYPPEIQERAHMLLMFLNFIAE